MKNKTDYIILDFDGTFIKEHVLISWVIFVLLKSNLKFKQKFFFFLKSGFRGLVSMSLSSYLSLSEWAVKFAFKTFKNIEIKIIDKMINHKKTDNKYLISLNTQLIDILKNILNKTKQKPEIIIYSQGSFNYFIKTFLNRKDVSDLLKQAGINQNLILIYSNELETNKYGNFTGKLIKPVQTKYNRIYAIKENSIFIGDNKDESAIKKMKIKNFQFINWKKYIYRL